MYTGYTYERFVGKLKKSINSLNEEERLFKHEKQSRQISEDKENLNDKEKVLREKRDKEDRESMKRQAELEVTKTELAKLQRKVENEIVSLKNRYKKSQINNLDDDLKFAANPRLVKIEVDTYEIDNPRQLERHSQNIKKREDNKNNDDRTNIKISEGNDENKRSVKRRMITYNEKDLVKTSEEDIDKKIEALKKVVRGQIDLDKRSKEVENSDLNFNEIKNIFSNKCALSNNVDKKVKKRSASFERKNKSKKKRVFQKRKKSVSKNISIENNAVDSNFITSKSKIKNSLREIRQTSHHDKSKYNKHLLHKNKYETKVVKKSVGNKNIKPKLFVSNLNRGKRRNEQASKRKAHVKRHYKRWDIVDREGRSVEAVENKNSNGEDQSDDGLNVLNSQDNAQIASEYKEAFGGFPKDPADSFTRYKRIKRYKS
ncbi:uncharacterized protein LOC141524975 [Cotesia typhae]|uniref:uncharacterized protein LOC141524975 n=1 Tax=Cotesia typhae TaxID=2053667 RepID=UPI003D69B1DD